jgi:hypothetical protein
MVFTFSAPIMSCGVPSNGTATANGNQCTVQLTGVPNGKYTTVQLIGVVDQNGHALNATQFNSSIQLRQRIP